MAKVYDVGHKMSEGTAMPMDKNKKMYPSISLTDKQLPILKGVEVGDKISLIALMKVTRSEEVERVGEKEECRYNLDILKLGEEGDVKLSRAFEKALGEHKEEDDDEDNNSSHKY